MADTGPLQSLGLARVAIATAGGDADEAVRLLVGALAFAAACARPMRNPNRPRRTGVRS